MGLRGRRKGAHITSESARSRQEARRSDIRSGTEGSDLTACHVARTPAIRCAILVDAGIHFHVAVKVDGELTHDIARI